MILLLYHNFGLLGHTLILSSTPKIWLDEDNDICVYLIKGDLKPQISSWKCQPYFSGLG